ncbi:MAG: solute carrier family 26 protein [Caldilineaceae bacterium]
MAVVGESGRQLRSAAGNQALQRYLPFLDWLVHYRRSDLPGDLMAGLIVAIMLVPQGMAYAMLAGLPPEVGLYASIVPLLIYGLLGSSRTLAVGPVAIVSLLVATAIAPLANGDVTVYVKLALTLAFLVGIIQVAMGLMRIGFLVNFLSHPVLVGFTAAAAIVIGFSQVKHLLGISLPRTERFYEQVLYTAQNLGGTNLVTLAIGLGSIAILLFFKHRMTRVLLGMGMSPAWALPIAKSAPLVIVVLGTLLVRLFNLDATAGVKIVGAVPAGLPPLTRPTLDLELWTLLLPAALTISFVGYMESVSVAKSLAGKRRQKIDPDQELIALGAANLGAGFTGGYPVTGGFSRSVVNFSAGANTGLASMITAGLIAVTVLFLTPLFYYLPNAVLAAIILVAVGNLFDLKAMRHIWAYNRGDALALGVTFVAVLALGIETGILVGAAVALMIYIWRTSKPHVAVVGRIGDSEVYRNELRYNVKTWPELIAMRVDESLYFANTKFLEDTILGMVADHPAVKHVVLIGSAVNFIDASALETLESLHAELAAAGVGLHFAEIKGPVLDRLRAIGFVEHIGADHFHFTMHDATLALGYVAREEHPDAYVSPAAAKSQQLRESLTSDAQTTHVSLIIDMSSYGSEGEIRGDTAGRGACVSLFSLGCLVCDLDDGVASARPLINQKRCFPRDWKRNTLSLGRSPAPLRHIGSPFCLTGSYQDFRFNYPPFPKYLDEIALEKRA